MSIYDVYPDERRHLPSRKICPVLQIRTVPRSYNGEIEPIQPDHTYITTHASSKSTVALHTHPYSPSEIMAINKTVPIIFSLSCFYLSSYPLLPIGFTVIDIIYIVEQHLLDTFKSRTSPSVEMTL